MVQSRVKGRKSSMSPEWPLFLPIPDIMEHTHSWGTSGRILYTHTCRQHVLDVRTCSKGHVHQVDSNPWWSFRGTFMQNGPLLETQMDLQKSDFRIFFRRSWRSRSDLFKSGLYLPWRRLPLDPAKTKPARTEQVHLYLSLLCLISLLSLSCLFWLIFRFSTPKKVRDTIRDACFTYYTKETLLEACCGHIVVSSTSSRG